MAEKLSSLPLFSQRVRFEHAINQALDAAQWPRPSLEDERAAMRGELAVYWYVTIYRHGQLRGHVGPITDRRVALLCAASWRESRHRAYVGRDPVGPALTNDY